MPRRKELLQLLSDERAINDSLLARLSLAEAAEAEAHQLRARLAGVRLAVDKLYRTAYPETADCILNDDDLC